MEECKKFLIASSPILVIMFVIGWALVGLKDALIFMGTFLFIVACILEIICFIEKEK